MDRLPGGLRRLVGRVSGVLSRNVHAQVEPGERLVDFGRDAADPRCHSLVRSMASFDEAQRRGAPVPDVLPLWFNVDNKMEEANMISLMRGRLGFARDIDLLQLCSCDSCARV